MTMRARLALIASAVAVAAVPADAAVVHYKNFRSPSKLINCISVKYGGKGVECYAPYLPHKFDLDPYYHLEPHGKTRKGERGDYVGYPGARNHTLHYGDTYKRNGISCHMEPSGLTCKNRDHHGFHMAKGDLRTF